MYRLVFVYVLIISGVVLKVINSLCKIRSEIFTTTANYSYLRVADAITTATVVRATPAIDATA